MNWLTDIAVTETPQASAPQANSISGKIQQLRVAADTFDQRGQARNASNARDMADKLKRFGSFKSDIQAGYADKLIGWASEAPRSRFMNAPAATINLPVLYAFLQGKLAELHLGDVKISRKRADTLLWVGYRGAFGSVQNGVFFPSKKWDDAACEFVTALLERLEQNPAEVIRAIGREYGECCLCGQELSNPESIAAGIGPICAGRI